MTTLREHWRALGNDAARADFAESIGTTFGHLRNVSYGFRPLAPEACVLAERVTSGALSRRDLRPSDWWAIWPELITADHPDPTREAA